MTEEQIECAVERKINALDRMLLKGQLTEDEYDQEIIHLDYWAEREYDKLYKRENVRYA